MLHNIYNVDGKFEYSSFNVCNSDNKGLEITKQALDMCVGYGINANDSVTFRHLLTSLNRNALIKTIVNKVCPELEGLVGTKLKNLYCDMLITMVAAPRFIFCFVPNYNTNTQSVAFKRTITPELINNATRCNITSVNTLVADPDDWFLRVLELKNGVWTCVYNTNHVTRQAVDTCYAYYVNILQNDIRTGVFGDNGKNIIKAANLPVFKGTRAVGYGKISYDLAYEARLVTVAMPSASKGNYILRFVKGTTLNAVLLPAYMPVVINKKDLELKIRHCILNH